MPSHSLYAAEADQKSDASEALALARADQRKETTKTDAHAKDPRGLTDEGSVVKLSARVGIGD